MKTERLRIRASQEDLEVLRSVAETLGLEASRAIWSVLREKQRELAVQAALALPAAKKKRPSAA